MTAGMIRAWATRGGLAALCLLPCAPVVAEPTFPEGCAPLVTVQNTDCEVDIYLACTAPERVRVQNYGPDGLDLVEEMTPDWSLKFSVDASGMSGLVVREGPQEPLSGRAVLEGGISEFSYPVDFYLGRPEPIRTRLTGAFRMTNRETELDGYALRRIETRMTVALGENALETIQTGYYSDAFGIFMEGPGSLRVGENVQQVDKGPAKIIAPGEPGFLSVAPLFNCEAEEAALSPGRAPGVLPNAGKERA